MYSMGEEMTLKMNILTTELTNQNFIHEETKRIIIHSRHFCILKKNPLGCGIKTFGAISQNSQYTHTATLFHGWENLLTSEQ